MAGLSLRERRVLALWAVVVLAGVSLSAAAAASRGACGREIVDGNLDGGARFVARDVIVYESGVIPGDPLIVRVVGEVTAPGWFTVRLPGLRAPDQMRVVGSRVDVTAYFVEDGSLHFFASPAAGPAGGEVSVYFIAGAGSWTHHFELDAEAAEMALVAKVNWRATTMFRHVDLLLVSGLVHAQDEPDYARGPPAPATAGGASAWGLGFAMSASSPATDGLAAFAMPSSTDTGIYVVHRADAVDIPGSSSHGVRSCAPAAFFVRVFESPVVQSDVVVLDDARIDLLGTSGGRARGAPLFVELRNLGELPWAAGRVDIYRDSILAGADELPYVARNGTARLEMGSAMDIRASRSLETINGTAFHNYTVRNLDVTAYLVEVESTPSNVRDLGPFAWKDGRLVASVEVPAGGEVRLGWTGDG